MSRPELVDRQADGAAGNVANGAARLRSGLSGHRAWWRDSLRRRMLAGADAVAGELAGLALVIGSGAGETAVLWALGFVPAWILAAKLHGLYDRDHRALRHLTVDELPRIGLWATTGVAGLAALLSLTPGGSVDVWAAIGAWLVASIGCFLLRSLARAVWRALIPPERTLIVGTGSVAQATERKLELFPDMHLELVRRQASLTAESLDGMLADLDRVILASQSVDEHAVEALLASCRRHETKLSVVPPVRGMFGTAVQLDHVADLPVLEYNTWDVSRSTLLLKRAMDVVVASAGLVLLSPVSLAVALAVWLESRRPIIFAQTRSGLGGRPFRMYKFRTMVADAEALLDGLVKFDQLPEPVFKLRDDPRITKVGRFLRRTSLDELPQLVNVLKGEMSLVGPRPEQIELVERYGPEHRFRLAVRPGLTGPMQVYGRGKLQFEERLAVEREYIENLSLGRDLRILALTLASVLSGKGAF